MKLPFVLRAAAAANITLKGRSLIVVLAIHGTIPGLSS
jgi:hypothetical protein